MDWLSIRQGTAPLIVSLPHTGTTLPAAIEADLVSTPLALRDTDWWVDRLYDFAADLGATMVHTAISRTVIDVNRDPSGASLYPGQATTGLCPTTTFDGVPLYRTGHEPDEAEIAWRRDQYFTPYHQALAVEVDRLRTLHSRIVVYDCHSIRSQVPRLFDGILPDFNIGTNDGRSAAPEAVALVETICDRSGFTRVTDGRFKGGWITRNSGDPANGVHAIQMELACATYMDEQEGDIPASYDETRAQPMRSALETILTALRDWASEPE
jgi:formiminoglutamase